MFFLLSGVTHQPSEVPRKEVGWDQPLWAQAHHLLPDREKRGGPAVQSDLVPPYDIQPSDVLLSGHCSQAEHQMDWRCKSGKNTYDNSGCTNHHYRLYSIRSLPVVPNVSVVGFVFLVTITTLDSTEVTRFACPVLMFSIARKVACDS